MLLVSVLTNVFPVIVLITLNPDNVHDLVCSTSLFCITAVMEVNYGTQFLGTVQVFITVQTRMCKTDRQRLAQQTSMSGVKSPCTEMIATVSFDR